MDIPLKVKNNNEINAPKNIKYEIYHMVNPKSYTCRYQWIDTDGFIQ